MNFFRGYTKAQTRVVVRYALEGMGFGEEFESEFISGLIREKHYYLSRVGIAPTKFRKLFSPGGYTFEGWFDGRGWFTVSWSKCIDEPDMRDHFVRALRDMAHPIVLAYRLAHPVCEVCAKAPAEEVDHAAPEFKEIASSLLDELTPEQEREAVDAFDYWKNEPFRFPESFRMDEKILAAHAGAKLVACCKPCHRASAKARKGKKVDG